MMYAAGKRKKAPSVIRGPISTPLEAVMLEIRKIAVNSATRTGYRLACTGMNWALPDVGVAGATATPCPGLWVSSLFFTSTTLTRGVAVAEMGYGRWFHPNPIRPVTVSVYSMPGRYAPSPSGDLHFGNLRTALLAWLFARHDGRDFFMRVEDIDEQRSTMESA